MKNSINKVTLSGNIGTIPTIKTTASNKKMAFLSLGTHEFLKTEEGKLKRITIWHKVILTGKLAEIGESLLTKGAAVQVAGKLVNRIVKSKDGLIHKTTEIRAKDLVIMGKA